MIAVDERPLSSKATFLATLPIFARLDEEALAALATIADEYEVPQGGVIAYQRDLASRLIIVSSGRLFASQVDELGIVRESRSYLPGDYFKDVWLFLAEPHPATVKAAADSRVVFIEQDKFLRFLDEYPDVLELLGLSEEAQSAAAGTPVAQSAREVRRLGLVADEIIEFDERRTVWLLVAKLAVPAILILAVLLGAGLLTGFSSTLVVVCTGVIVGALLLASVGIALDWANDYFVITNKHLVHREYNLFRFQAAVKKIPVDQIQSVEIIKPGLIANVLQVGTARITTASQAGVLLFDYIERPDRVQAIVARLREQVRAVDAGRAQAVMRSTLEEYFQSAAPYRPVAEVEAEEEEAQAPRAGFLSALRRALGSRVVEGEVITYRKHFVSLLGRIWRVALLSLALLAGTALVPWLPVAVILLVLWLGSFGWLVWRFEDWRNDTFQLTNRYVIDIDRRPFGFGESRKQAQLDDIQNVDARRPGLFATIFNFGNVEIETAGATANITFERVVNPSLVQSDIFQRREAYSRLKLVEEGARRRQEYAVLLDVYQQAQEQNRIPRRTAAEEGEEES